MTIEMIDIINEQNESIGKATFEEVVKKRLLHRAVKIIVMNDKDEFLLCKMPENKKFTKDKYQIGTWGEVLANEAFEDAMYRTLKETLNIDAPPTYIKQFKYEDKAKKVIVELFVLSYEEDIKVNQIKVKNTMFKTSAQLEQMIDKNELSPISEYITINFLSEIKECAKY